MASTVQINDPRFGDGQVTQHDRAGRSRVVGWVRYNGRSAGTYSVRGQNLTWNQEVAEYRNAADAAQALVDTADARLLGWS